jgi:hypothetical protein
VKKKIKKAKSFKPYRAKSVAPKVSATFPAHLMGTPPAGGGPNNADTEMRNLMQNKGVARKKAS